MATLNFKPKIVSKKILSPLNERAYEVVESRLGLGDSPERKTLEAIGKKLGVTRERVRQIESAALLTVKKSDIFEELAGAFEDLRNTMQALGTVVAEDDFLAHISSDPSVQNHIRLFLVLGDGFSRYREDDNFRARWSTDKQVAKAVEEALVRMSTSLTHDDLLSEKEMVSRLLDYVEAPMSREKEDVVLRWLSISKDIDKNPLGEWGLITSPNIKTKGVKDYAFLVMRKHGSPMHFTEVADAICKVFGRDTNPATCHNELIKDDRFVIVGRGTYGLTDWGYRPGIVREVIRDILEEEGPMTREEIVDRVIKERFVKKNTIIVNLQNPKYFKRTKDGRYRAIK